METVNWASPLSPCPPLEGRVNFMSWYGRLLGRSSDLQARLPTGRGFPVRGRTSAYWAFVPAYRCGAVPDLNRIPFSPDHLWDQAP